MKRRILAFFLVALSVGGLCVACQQGYRLSKPIHGAKLKPKVGSGPGQRFGAAGAAERLESNDWRLTLVFAGLDPDSVEGIRLLDDLGDPKPLSLHDADGRLAVTWEVPRERWLDGEPFELSMRLHGQDDETLIAVGHRAAESEPTILGYAVQHALSIAIGSRL